MVLETGDLVLLNGNYLLAGGGAGRSDDVLISNYTEFGSPGRDTLTS